MTKNWIENIVYLHFANKRRRSKNTKITDTYNNTFVEFK